jgi:UDP-glucose 4-epimerase
MNSIVLTGATSMLGIALINECIKNNTKVLAIIRKDSSNINRIPISEYVKVLECNLDEIHHLNIARDDYEIFFHFAWDHTGRKNRDNAICQNDNIKYTLDAVELADRLGCSTFIGAGSQAEYGRVEKIISPDTPVNPDIAYGVAKYTAGKLSRILCRDLGMKHIWTRVFSVYGPYDNNDTMIMYAIRTLMSKNVPKFTKSEQLWDYMYCDDAARAFYLIGKNGKENATYCIGSGEVRKLSEYIYIIRDNINKDLNIEIGKKNYSDNQVMHLCADISKLTADTGFYTGIPFEKGIKMVLEWFTKEKML